MAKKDSGELVFLTGCDLSDGRRFEKGDKVPADVKKEDLAALKEMKAVGVAEAE